MSIAEQIVDLGHSKGIEISLHCLGDVGKTWDLEEAKTVVIISSTTGDGEQPENVIKFWRKLRPKNLASDHLSYLEFALLGLGDTNYNQFCNAPKALYRRLSELGAKPFHPAGWADDGTGLEEVVEPWIEGLWDSLISAMDGKKDNTRSEDPKPVENGTSEAVLTSKLSSISLSPRTLPPCPKSFIAITYSDAIVPASASLQQCPLPSSNGPLLTAHVKSCERLTTSDAVKHYYSIHLECPEFTHMPGDTVSIVCTNTDQDLDMLKERLKLEVDWDKECTLCIAADTRKPKARLPEWLPVSSSLKIIFQHHLDIRAVPKKPLIRGLVEYTQAEKDRDFLSLLCSKEGSSEYMTKVRNAQMTLLELLDLVPSCIPPPTLLIEQLPRLLARPYSLSSSPLATPGQISWLFTLVTEPRPGLATSFLSKLAPMDKLNVQPRLAHYFRPPEDLGLNFIMVGAGSGLGPFLGFLQDRKVRKLRGDKMTGNCWLVFGCRYKDKDFIYKTELEGLVEGGVLDKLSVCFSREGKGPKYVQDYLKEEKQTLTNWLVEKKALFYVCGDAKGMARGVQEVVEEAVEESMGWESGQGKSYVKNMIDEKRYKEDIWT